MSEKNSSDPVKGGSAESQSGAGGNNEAHGNSKPSEPGMTPGISQKGSESGKDAEKENADLEQQYKETLTERD